MDDVGQNLTDFPRPDGTNEREAMKLILSTEPLLNAHVSGGQSA
jgi:hypothetical protein